MFACIGQAGLHPFEASELLPVGDALVELREPDLGHARVVVDDLGPEGLGRGLAVSEQLKCHPQVARHSRGCGPVRVPRHRGGQRQLLGNASQSSSADGAATTRCGFMSAPGRRCSNRSECPLPTTRSAQVRLSMPREMAVGAYSLRRTACRS
ncbi:hypothetical protein BH18ACI1_BH18ACI1_24450 [soil metagenome]